MGRIRTRTCLALISGLAAGVVSAAPAQATYHEMKISQIGQGGGGVTDYVVLQMYAPGQNLVAGKFIQTYNAAGMIQTTFTFPNDVPLGENQRTIYIARDDGPPLGTPDFTTPNLILTNDGAVCYGAAFGPAQAIDCVSYGAFPGVVGGDPSPMGTPAPAPAGGQAIQRSIAAGCPTLLEAGDDTDNSSGDFALAAPSPRNNAAPTTETPCAGSSAPNTKIRKRPKNRSDDTSPTFKFKSTEVGSTFKCKLDHKKFHKCKSPKTYHRLDPGKHTFKVEAIDSDGNIDSTPAKDKFKVLP